MKKIQHTHISSQKKKQKPQEEEEEEEEDEEDEDDDDEDQQVKQHTNEQEKTIACIIMHKSCIASFSETAISR